MNTKSEIENRNFFNNLSSTWDEHNTCKIDIVFEVINLKENDVVLDVGCGTGILDKRINYITRSKVVGLDISDKMLEVAKKKNDIDDIIYINQSFYDYNEGGFDKIIIYNAYPHFVLLEEFKEALYRNLKKEGLFLICHSLSRERLNEHHKYLSKDISRDLFDVNKESSFYADLFDIIKAYEDDDCFYILGMKR